MRTEFTKSFARDLRKLNNDKIFLTRVQKVIEAVEQAEDIFQISNLKKLKSEGNYYRIRCGAYRIGITIKSDLVTFIRILPRKEIYRYFP
jgi:mRNA interferase RelE/StbE